MNANVQPLRRAPELRYARIAGRCVDVAANRIRRDGVEVRLTPKAMGVLRELVARPGQVVKRDDLLGIVWRDGFPTDDVLTHAITELRRVLEDDPRAPRVIETIPRVGYRLLAPVEPLEAMPPLAVAAPAEPVVTADALVATGATSPPMQRAAALLVLAAILAAASIAWWIGRPVATTAAPPAGASTTPVRAPPVSNLRAVTADPAREQFPSLSPDGSSVAYVRNVAGEDEGGGILLRSLDAGATPRMLTQPPEGSRDDFPVWSPDGTRIAFLRWSDGGCAIHVIPALGGPSRRVAPCRMRVLDYLEWTPDGTGLLLCRAIDGTSGSSARGAIQRLDLATGNLVPIPYTTSADESDIQARVSPDGDTLAFRRGGAPYSDIHVVPLAGGEPRRVTHLRSRIRGYAWYPDNAALLVSSDHEGRQALYRVEVASGVVEPLGIEDAEFPDVARHAGIVVFQKENRLSQLAEVSLTDDAGEPRMLAPATRSDAMPAHAPDGKRVAFVSSRSGAMQLWIYDYATDSAHQLTRYENVGLESPRWSPDGSRILHVVRGGGQSRLSIVEVDSGRIATVSGDQENVRYGSYSHDGTTIYFSSDRGGAWQPYQMPARGGWSERLAEIDAIDPQAPLGDGFLYMTQESTRGLWRLDLATREIARVAPNVGYWNRNAWTVRPEGIYVLDVNEDEMGGMLWREPPQPRSASDEDWEGFERTKVRALPLALASFDLSLAPDAQSAVLSITTRDETDLMAADLAVESKAKLQR